MVLVGGQPVPAPAAGEVLIKLAYAGVNRPDVMQRKGLYPPPPGHSTTLGLEVSSCCSKSDGRDEMLSQELCPSPEAHSTDVN